MKHVARRRFGQHFLNDPAVIDAIVRDIAPRAGEVMVEIGPGLAALTQPLVQRLGRLTVIELDRDLATRLRLNDRLEVIESDVLRVDFTALGRRLLSADARADAVPLRPVLAGQGRFEAGVEVGHVGSGAAAPPVAGHTSGGLRIVGNLPYNISTPILFHLLEHVAVMRDQHFMLQKEVVDRMVAKPATADYGRLSVMLQWRYAMDCLMQVSPGSFDPPPRVNSAIVRMVPWREPPAVELPLYGELVQTAFSQRRKILRNTLGRWLDARHFSGHFDLQRRAEEVPVDEYVALAQAVQ